MTITGKCHCGRTAFEVTEAPTSVTRCTCTFCSKRGGLWAYYDPQHVRFISSRDQVSYSSRPDIQKHYHCDVCGCSTHSDTPVWENFQLVPGKRRVTINARLLEDFDVEAVPVTVIDGRNLW
jgi:hypothetical protein